MGSLSPTPEQQAIIDACRAGKTTVIEAGAGTGKTSTLRMAAEDMRGRGVYIAYNAAIARESRQSFPEHVRCSTAHSLAYRAVVTDAVKARLNGPRQTARIAADKMHLRRPVPLATPGVFLPPHHLARLAIATVDRFCQSADTEVQASHVPELDGYLPVDVGAVQQHVVPLARKVWIDYQHPKGKLKVSHDAYLKWWAMSRPRLDADFIFFDEAQDANGVLAELVQAQPCQTVAVGDSAQQLYQWRGSIDALKTWPAQERLLLSQSWRFGPAIADEANKWLSLLDTPLRLTGAPHQASVVCDVEAPDAVLCRTNAEAVGQVMRAVDAGTRVALVGGGRQMVSLARAAQQLKDGQPTDHPELFVFGSWGELQDYAENEESGADLRVFVKLVDEHGPEKIIAALDGLADEDRADLVVSTAHRAKGREWSQVRIAEDFQPPKDTDEGCPGEPVAAEVMLAYVAVTRARGRLQRGALSYVDRYAAPAPVG